MKYNLRAVLGTAAVAVAVLAGTTACGSLANNAAGLERNAEARVSANAGHVRENTSAYTGNRHLTNRGHRRNATRHNEMRTNRVGRENRHGLNQNHAQRRYLQHEDLTLQNGRFLGDGVNPPSQNANNISRHAAHQMRRDNNVRDLAHRNYETDVVGADGVVRNNVQNTNRHTTANRNNQPQRTYNTNRIANEQGITIS